jgi:hypothetical protein
MKIHLKILARIFLFASLCPVTAVASSLELDHFTEVYAAGSKEKQADLVYVMSDGAIAKKGTPGASPAIMLSLTNEPEHLVMQDILMRPPSKILDVSVDVWASPDLKHGKGDGTWSEAGPGTYYIQGTTVHPDVDFWVLRGVGHGYCLTNLERGKWNHVSAHFTSPYDLNSDYFEFHVPIGAGFVLLRNFETDSD